MLTLGRTSKVIPQGGTSVTGCWGPVASSKIATKTSAILDFTQNQKLSKKRRKLKIVHCRHNESEIIKYFLDFCRHFALASKKVEET